MVIKRPRLVTLGTVAAIAAALFRLRRLLYFAGFAAAAWFFLTLANPQATSVDALLPLSLGLWVALALGIGSTLTRPPPAIEPDDGLGRRIRKRLARLGYGLAVAAVIALGAFVVLLSIRAVSLTMA